MAEGTASILTLDCANKLRVHYLLPEPLSVEMAEALWPGRVRLRAFSRVSAGAQDLVEVRLRGTHASGAVGGRRLVVTFGKLGAHAAPQAREALEAQMDGIGLGPVLQPAKRCA